MKSAFIPYGAYWSTPFAKWQGSLSHLHSLRFAAHSADLMLRAREIDRTRIDLGILGMTVPQQGTFYGVPWLFGELGCERVAGTTISQACATGARVLTTAAQEIGMGTAECVLALTADRVSNGPNIYYPDPGGPGGTGRSENWVMDNFGKDPFAGVDMTTTAENCAERWQVATHRQHEVAARRYAQYQDALADDSAFLKRFMTLPFDVPDARLKKVLGRIDGDEGVHPATLESMEKLKPVKPGGSITYAGQTHPADGNAGLLVTSRDMARELATDPSIAVRFVSHGQARVEPAMMPSAPIPAARQALARAELDVAQLSAIKSHNPFAVNDIIFAIEMGVDVMQMNNYGSSLVWGHPQAPTGTRAIIELIEELALRGGGYGLFQGCAGGDSAMAIVLHVSDAER